MQIDSDAACPKIALRSLLISFSLARQWEPAELVNIIQRKCLLQNVKSGKL